MGIQVSNWVENIARKEEIALYEQSLLFPQCFQKLSVVVALKCVYGVNGYTIDHVGQVSFPRKFISFHLLHYPIPHNSNPVSDDNFRIDKNGIKLSKWVENTVRKEEIARYKQFLLSPQCFQKACFPGASKGVIVWE